MEFTDDSPRQGIQRLWFKFSFKLFKKGLRNTVINYFENWKSLWKTRKKNLQVEKIRDLHKLSKKKFFSFSAPEFQILF